MFVVCYRIFSHLFKYFLRVPYVTSFVVGVADTVTIKLLVLRVYILVPPVTCLLTLFIVFWKVDKVLNFYEIKYINLVFDVLYMYYFYKNL